MWLSGIFSKVNGIQRLTHLDDSHIVISCGSEISLNTASSIKLKIGRIYYKIISSMCCIEKNVNSDTEEVSTIKSK